MADSPGVVDTLKAGLDYINPIKPVSDALQGKPQSPNVFTKTVGEPVKTEPLSPQARYEQAEKAANRSNPSYGKE